MEEASTNIVSTTIPSDIVHEIFCRFPVKSLLRFRCISKTWRDTIDSLSFAREHLLATAAANANIADEDGNQILYNPHDQHSSAKYTLQFLQHHKSNVLQNGNDYAMFQNGNDYAMFDFTSFFLIGCIAFGLVLLVFKEIHNYEDSDGIVKLCLCNPFRREILELPNPTLCNPKETIVFDMYRMGFDSTTNTYKIVRVVVVTKYSARVVTEILCLGTTSWRRISSVPPCTADNMACGTGVSAYGDMHWADDVNNFRKIISFDFKKEEFKETSKGLRNSQRVRLINLRECLAIVNYSSAEYTEIWMLKDYGKVKTTECWVKEYQIRNHNHVICRFQFVGAFRQGVYFDSYPSKGHVVYFDLKKKRHIYLKFPKNKGFVKRFYSTTRAILSLKNFGDLMPPAAVENNEKNQQVKSLKFVVSTLPQYL